MGIGQMIEIDKVKNKHYTEVIAKLPAVDYVVTPSQDLVDEILTGSLQAKQEMFKMAANAKNLEIDSKKTFKPNEIRELQAFNQLLEQMIRANSRDIKLGFQLVERMKAYNEKAQTLTSQLVVAGLKRGCSIADLDNRFADKQIVTAEVKSDDKKSVADRLRDMVQIDTSRGLEISLSNEQRLRDAFISNRTKLRELNAGFAESMRERYRKVNDQLVPFAARAFDTFKVTGFTRSNKL